MKSNESNKVGLGNGENGTRKDARQDLKVGIFVSRYGDCTRLEREGCRQSQPSLWTSFSLRRGGGFGDEYLSSTRCVRSKSSSFIFRFLVH